MGIVVEALGLVTFFFAFVGGWLVSIGLAIAVAVLDRRRIRWVVAGACALVSSAGGVVTFWSWGVGFDTADALRAVPAWVDPVTNTGIWLANAGGLGVLVLLALAVRRSIRLSAGPTPAHT